MFFIDSSIIVPGTCLDPPSSFNHGSRSLTERLPQPWFPELRPWFSAPAGPRTHKPLPQPRQSSEKVPGTVPVPANRREHFPESLRTFMATMIPGPTLKRQGHKTRHPEAYGDWLTGIVLFGEQLFVFASSSFRYSDFLIWKVVVGTGARLASV